jgi:hypothetical protein
MRPRKATRKKHRNFTAHQRAAADEKVRDLILSLRREWDKIDRIERGNKLRQLADAGCSKRGLAGALGLSATTIHRHMTVASLPESEREAIKAGSSAKKILARKASVDRTRRIQEQIALDAKTGELSDRVADTIIAFCSKVKGVRELRIYEHELVFFLSEVRNAAWAFEAAGVRPEKFAKRTSLKQRIAKTRPLFRQDVIFMPYMAEWLATLLLAEMPLRPIWERAIEKAGKRSKELRIKRTARQLYEERRQWLQQISATPPPRKVYSGGAARHMQRQGQGVPKGPRDH